jgi:hypothetical protein
MSLVDFLRIVYRNLFLLLFSATLLAGLIGFSSSKEKSTYSSSTLINTGVVSGYNIESSGNTKVDRDFTNNELENLISLATAKNTQMDLVIRLLARITDPVWVDTSGVMKETIAELKIEVTPQIWETIAAGKTLEDRERLVRAEYAKGGNSPVYELFHSKNDLLGLQTLEATIKVVRERTSDMIRFSYTTTDPGLCKETLVELTRIFIRKHKAIKEGQTTDVIDYFGDATKNAADQLRNMEDMLLGFQVDNKIINYYEQTRFIANKKEDLEDTYMKELMDLVSADSAIVALESRMVNYIMVPELHEALATKREQLRGAMAQLANASLFTEEQGSEKAIAGYEAEVRRLKQELKEVTKTSFAAMNTHEGIPVDAIMNPWLEAIIRAEESKARINIIKARRDDFEVIYGKFAPWGSTLKRIERGIDVAEREYLENLHSLNQARLHEYSMMMSTNLRIVDAPTYPAHAEKSKAVMMTIVGFLAGLIIPLALLIALELLDRGLNSPEKAMHVTELDLATALPQVPRKKRQRKLVDFEKLNEMMTDLLVRHLQLASVLHPNLKLVGVSSSNVLAGKTYVLNMLAKKLVYNGLRPLLMVPMGSESIHESVEVVFYDPNIQTFQKESVADILNKLQPDWQSYDFVLMELPAWKKASFPVPRLGELHYHLWVIQAGQVWSDSDRKAVETLAHACGLAPSLVVNRLRPDTLEDLIGDIPRSRSSFRKFVKRIAKLQFTKS